MKKKSIIHLTFAVMMLMPPLHATAIGIINHSVTYTAQYSSANLNIGTDTLAGVTYSVVSYDGMYNSGTPGMPSLPVDYLKFSVPYNATNFTVTTTIRTWQNQSLGYLLYPCQVPMCTDCSDTLVITLPDSSAYFSDTYYPNQVAWVAAEGFLAGENHVVTVAVQPFRYQHTSTADQLSMARSCNITLRYELSDSLGLKPIVRNDSSLREEGYQLTQSMVVNPGQVKTNAPGQIFTFNDSLIFVQDGIGGDVLNGGGNSLPGDTIAVDTTGQALDHTKYNYLIVTTSELKHAVRRIAALKRQEGYRVEIMTLDQIYSNSYSRYGLIEEDNNGVYTICDTTGFGKMRQFLRYALKYTNIEFVLLVGSDVPYRIEPYLPNSACFTDWYYCELSSNLLTSKFDDEPDLFVGRILAKEPEQIDNYTDKLFRYELNPGHGEGTDYLKRSLFTASAIDKIGLFEEIPHFASLFNRQDTIFEQQNANYPKGHEVVDSINANHYGFLCSQNHGSATCLKMYGADNQNRSYFIWAHDGENNGDTSETGNSLNMIHNKYRPMIYYSLACQTIPYNYNGVCFGESFTTGKDYGGPVYIGFTDQTYNIQSREILRRFSYNLFLPEVDFNINKAMILAKSGDFINRNNIISKVHNYIGDPSIKIWTVPPASFTDISIIRTNNSITIAGNDVNNSTVSYISNNWRQVSCSSSSSSVTFSGVSPNGSIMVNKHNYFPYIAPIVLQNIKISNSQYVITSDLTAGCNVDSNRTSGNVIVKKGVTYELEITGNVRLENGVRVERGAELIIKPSCF